METKLSSYFFFILLLAVSVIVVLIFLPFLTPLILAVAAAIITYPFYRSMTKVFGGGSFGRTVSALVTVIFTAAVIVVPLFLLTGSIYSEIQTLYGLLTDEGNRSELVDVLNKASQGLSDMVFGVLPAQSFDALNVTSYIKGALEMVFTNLDGIFSSMTKVAGYALVFLIATFYLLKDGRALKDLFMSWSPLLGDNEKYITYTFKRAVRSVFAGSLVVSVLEGVSVGCAFWAFGIPAPALWGTVAAVAALIPGLGTSLLILPGVAYLSITGHYAFAAGLFIWGYAGIVIIDHMIGPALINQAVRIHPFLVLISVLGGIVLFGIPGFFIGPLILVFLFVLLEIYKASFRRTIG